VTKYLRKSDKKEKGLFWLVVSEASVHGQLVPLLWACGKAEYNGQELLIS
jgi:hypothetical protein